MKKIMLLARDPGGANTIIPLLQPLIERGYKVSFYGKDAALDRYQQMGLQGLDISKFLPVIDIDGWMDFLHSEQPDFIITGTSGNDFSERYLWEAARKCSIMSFAILDQWINYGIRFSSFGLDEMDEYDKCKHHHYLPDRILVMDDEARMQLLNEGIDDSRILISGQPYFDLVLQKSCFMNSEMSNVIRNHFICDKSEIIISYISEPLSLDYPEKSPGDYHLGFDEKTNCRKILNGIKDVTSFSEQRVCFIIKQHPRETADNYSEIVNEFNSEFIRVVVLRDFDSWFLLYSSDLVCGMSSMLLLEAVLLGRPVLSIEVGLKVANPFVLVGEVSYVQL